MKLTAAQIKITIKNHRASHLFLADAYKKRAEESHASGNRASEEAQTALWREHMHAAYVLEELIVDLQEAEGQSLLENRDAEQAITNFQTA